MAGGVLKVEIVKRADGAGLLRCIRADNSITWQKQSERQAVHFVHHDLTHYAVETSLGYEQGFFGLIAAGWNIEDTTGKGARGRLPDEAGEVESVVGLFDRERGSRTLWTVEEFTRYAPAKMRRALDDAAIQTVRSARADLFRRWAEVEVGSQLQLDYALGQSAMPGSGASMPNAVARAIK